jgi:CRISPR/Cas system-associated protein endoribonuclease Cas2
MNISTRKWELRYESGIGYTLTRKSDNAVEVIPGKPNVKILIQTEKQFDKTCEKVFANKQWE